jgi:pyruvate/2-oxoacid:ferredoxin oxidoreductase beta subunit
VIPACCWTNIAGFFPSTSLKVPVLHTAFETAAIVAVGVKKGLQVRGQKDVTVLAWAGDGGTFDIGIQSVSGAAERNDDIIYVCYDNEAYMNTGIQRSSATPWGAWTSTTPVSQFKERPKKDMVEIMAAHRIPYAATASIAYPEDLRRKFLKAKSTRGMKFIHILAPCPAGWRYPSELTVKMARLAVQTRMFPLYEVENGRKYTVNLHSESLPIGEYMGFQGRFKHLKKPEIQAIQKNVEREWKNLVKKSKVLS